jgi:AcrR family transcriptional regulator
MARRPSAPKRAKPRAPLTRERIVDTALQLIDQHGLEALSMRRLGAALHVEAMALYHHFANKGELLDAVLDRLMDEVELPPRGAMPPLERLRHFARSYRQMALRHPNAFILVPTRRFNTEYTIGRYEKILEAFSDLGFDAALSARYFRTMGYFASGAGQADIASHARQPDATPVRLENFSDPHFPLVSAVVPHLRTTNLDAIFEFGLDVICDAMRRDAAEATQKKLS